MISTSWRHFSLLLFLSLLCSLRAAENTNVQRDKSQFFETWCDPQFLSYRIQRVGVRIPAEAQDATKYDRLHLNLLPQTAAFAFALEKKHYDVVILTKGTPTAKGLGAVLEVTSQAKKTDVVGAEREGPFVKVSWEWQLKQSAKLTLANSDKVVFKAQGRKQDMARRVAGKGDEGLMLQYTQIIDDLPDALSNTANIPSSIVPVAATPEKLCGFKLGMTFSEAKKVAQLYDDGLVYPPPKTGDRVAQYIPSVRYSAHQTFQRVGSVTIGFIPPDPGRLGYIHWVVLGTYEHIFAALRRDFCDPTQTNGITSEWDFSDRKLKLVRIPPEAVVDGSNVAANISLALKSAIDIDSLHWSNF